MLWAWKKRKVVEVPADSVQRKRLCTLHVFDLDRREDHLVVTPPEGIDIGGFRIYNM